MIYKVGSPSEPDAAHKAKWGGFNDRPEGLREVTPAEIAEGHWLEQHVQLMEYRQMKHQSTANGWPLQAIMLYFLDDNTGYGLSYDYWNQTVQWWLFGCKHEWGGELTDAEKRLLNSSFLHPYKCKKCGHFHYTDSSG